MVFLDVGCTRFFGSGILLGFFGFGFFSFADTNIYKNKAEMKLFRLRCGFARRKKRLPDERNLKSEIEAGYTTYSVLNNCLSDKNEGKGGWYWGD